MSGWREFAGNMATHKQHHLYGERRVGLSFLFTHRLGSLDFDESREDRAVFYDRQKGVLAASSAALLVLSLLVARRQRPWNAQLLGLVPTFALLVTSRYYWSYLSLLPLIGGERGPPAERSRWLAGAQLLLFAAFWSYNSLHDDAYATYIVFNVLLLVYLVAVLLLAFAGRPSGDSSRFGHEGATT